MKIGTQLRIDKSYILMFKKKKFPFIFLPNKV